MAKSPQIPQGHTRVTFNIREDLHSALKHAVVDEKKNMTEVLVGLIEEYVRKHQRKKDRR